MAAEAVDEEVDCSNRVGDGWVLSRDNLSAYIFMPGHVGEKIHVWFELGTLGQCLEVFMVTRPCAIEVRFKEGDQLVRGGPGIRMDDQVGE